MSSAAERLRQISRTYSTGSLPSNNSSPISSPSSAVPSFTLTFPIIPQNSDPSQNKAGKLENNSSSQTEKLKNNSKKGTLDIYAKQAACKDGHSTSSNNGFPFTISNILEKEHNSKKQIVETDEQLRENMITHPCTPLYERKNDIGQNNVLPVNSVENEGGNKNSQSASEKTSIPTVSWTMNVVAPKINTSEEIDEDYDA
jgi:aspartate-semialdehyde dehydrogenase